MIHFINNIGDYFASNYFDEDFSKKVIDKSGFSSDAIKDINQRINKIKPEYFKLKQRFIEDHLRTKDKINLSHQFHTKVLEALGYDASQTNYHELFPINDKSVLPIRHILYRGDTPHLMVMEMHALIKTSLDEEPDGLFEQRYHLKDEEDNKTSKEQKYHRSQWADIFTVPEGVSISPMIINQAVNELFLLPVHRRPKYILLCGGNQYFLLEAEKWFRGSYLQIDLDALLDDVVINKNYYAVFYLLLGKQLLAPTAEIVLMEQLEEDAHKAAYEVTKDLKEGVIHAVEKLANEAVESLSSQGLNFEDINADRLKEDCLNMVYRLLFLFYAESREDLDILPSNDDVYERGYSLEMLRDLELVPLVTESSRNGDFFHQSLFQLFDLLNKGYGEKEGLDKSFKIRHLDSPMFNSDNLHYLNRVKIRNVVWQDVICQLSLSKLQNNKTRGRISYANLGINQLGSVYESLLAFRGFLAETDYIEVHRKRKSGESSEKVVNKDGSFLVPRHRLDDFDPKEIYYEERADGSEDLKVIPQGTFIYRLSGRDRQKSASYYTPEVLTQTTVKYTLKPILERLDEGEIEALDLLNLKILEPAMGAAAFHNEVINQLAHAYLTYRQQELKRQVDPNKYQEELQKIKAHIALNNVYGVDLDPTAVELGKLSLWLNVIHKDMQTPFFGYRLGVGNAVIGSWLKVFKHKDFSFEAKGKGSKKKEWWEIAPKHLKFGKKGILRREDEIYHFLLADKGMAASGNIKLLKDAYPDEARRVSDWRKDFITPLRKEEFVKVQRISQAIDALLLEHYEIQKNIALVTEVNANYFGNPNEVITLDFQSYTYEQKQQFAQERLKTNAPYYKLKQIMDYWCSLWFWDVRDAKDLPTRSQWYDDIEQILNIDLENVTQIEVTDEEVVRDYRKDKKAIEKQLVEALKQSPFSLFENERSVLVKKYTDQYKYFHYELEFIEVFRESNGFDIIAGNPPWVNITMDEAGILSEKNPEIIIRKFSAPKVKRIAQSILSANLELEMLYKKEFILAEATKEFLGSIQNYPLLQGQRNNLYKCILANSFKLISNNGFIGLLHPEGIYDDPKGQELRKEVYLRLKYHFQFKNELMLFSEIDHHNFYGVHIYGMNDGEIDFLSMNNLFHPSTIEGSFIHSGSGLAGGIKIKEENSGKMIWNITPHRDRIVRITKKELSILAKTFENSENFASARLVNIHAVGFLEILKKLSEVNARIGAKGPFITDCFNETNAVKDGSLNKETKFVKISSGAFVYNGPHFFVSTPIYKSPREICSHNSMYDFVDLMSWENSTIRSNFSPSAKGLNFLREVIGVKPNVNWFEDYRMLWSRMVSLTGERTLQACIIPPRTSHIDVAFSAQFKCNKELLEVIGLCSSLTIDWFVRATGVDNIRGHVMRSLPSEVNIKFKKPLLLRVLLLNALTEDYSALWESLYNDVMDSNDSWSIDNDRLRAITTLKEIWEWTTPLRGEYERRQALVEIDVITAMALNLTLDELILIYNVQFPVLQQNEDDTWYDIKGNIVFTCSKGLVGVGLDRADWNEIKDMPAGETYEHTITKSELYQGEKVTYYAPFDKCDRVEDYKRAWAHFEERFKDA